MKLKPYSSNEEYMKEHLEIINCYLSIYAAEFTKKVHTSGRTHLKKSFTSKDEVDNALESTVLGYSKGSNASDLDVMIETLKARTNLTIDNEAYESSVVFLPFEYLARIFKLSDFERFVVMLSFCVELDRKYEKIFGYLNDFGSMRYPTVQTACLIYDHDTSNYMKHLTYFHNDSKLMKYFFEEESTSLSGRQLKLVETIRGFMLDSDLETILLPDFLNLYLPDEKPEKLRMHFELSDRIRNYLTNLSAAKGRRIIMNVHGPAGIGRLKQVKHFCHVYKHSAVVVSARRLSELKNQGHKSYKLALKQIAQTLLIHQAVLVLSDVDIEEDRELVKSVFKNFLSEYAPFVKVTFVLSDKPLPSLTTPDQSLTVLRVEMNYPLGLERKALFDNVLSSFRFNVSADLNSVASKFVFTPDQIENAVHDAIELSKWEGNAYIDSATMHKACRSQLNHNLDKRTQRIDAGGDWNRLILPGSSKDMLQEVCTHVKYKSQVLDEWGFKDHLTYGTGLAVLFAGPPGTGKTFSARILAKELDLELYKVDLSQMIDKYIGETEKNISALFDDAAGSSAILLFDEGDALFGKRTETKDSHDRYANVETAFLLQKVEAYEGISILTTNFMQNIDPAFLRRFRFVVHFPIPDVESRLLIWKGIYPEPVPISKHVDFDFLAKNFELTGGHIKNIALSSAFKAASNGGKVDMKSIMLSIQHELGKTGKAVLRSDFGEYAYMLDE